MAPAAPRAQLPLHRSGDRVACTREEVSATSTNLATDRRMVAESAGVESMEFAQHDTYELTAQEVPEELRSITDWLDVDVQNQFDWKTCEEEQGRFDTKDDDQPVVCWTGDGGGEVSKYAHGEGSPGNKGALNPKQRNHGRDGVQVGASGDAKDPGTLLGLG